MVRILVCASEAPLPPLNGFRLQLIPVLRQLSLRHEVSTLAYRWPEQHAGDAEEGDLQLLELPRHGSPARAARWLRPGDPLGARITTGPMARALESLLAERSFDVVHVAGWALARLVDRLDGVPAVITALDAWHVNYEAKAEIVAPALRPLYRLEQRRIRRYESTAYLPYFATVVVSEEDARALRRLEPRLRVEVISNGVDGERFAPNPAVAVERGLVVFTGAMHWPPNVRAAVFLAREVIPRLRERHGEARLAVVGRSPAREVLELGRLPGVEVVGEVADVRDWLWRAEAFACPMVSGTGIKNKLLEAMACGVACVATSLSCQGMSARPGRDLLVADDAPRFASSLAAVLEDAPLRERLGAAAREYTLETHDWHAVGAAYERLLEEAARSRPKAAARH